MYDKKFQAVLEILFPSEGGYNNRKNDPGGPTNLGITHTTFDNWRKMHNRPTEDIRNITRQEAEEIYYNWYWKASGADKQEDIRDALILFDTAVQYGDVAARSMFKAANNNFYTMLENRKKTYYQRVIDKPSQKEHLQGWLNRIDNLEKRADELIKDPDFRPSYADTKTPFDDDYTGGLKKLNNISDPKEKQRLKNKYQYLLNKNGTPTGYAADIDSGIDTRTPSQRLDDEIREKYKRMKNQRLQRVFGKSSGSSGKGRWVTINGNHVFIED